MNSFKIKKHNYRLARLSVTRLFAALPVSLVVGHASAIDLYATTQAGLDSNPHHLTESHAPEQQEFIYTDIKLSTNYQKKFYAKASAKKTHFINDERGDWFKSKIDLLFKSKFKLSKSKFRYRISADHNTYDKTYISKTTGNVATYNGQSIADRYDSTTTNFKALLSYKTKQNATFKSYFQQRTKSYESLNIEGLSNLDYGHNRFGFEVDYRVSDTGKFFADSGVTTRDYDDRRAKDLQGEDVLNTDLQYDYKDIKVGYSHRPEKGAHWKYTFKYSMRTDNNSGYWDSDSGYVSIYSKYQFGDWQSLSTTLKYSKFSYENQLDTSLESLDEETKERQGFSLKLNYQWTLATLFETEVALYVSLEAATFESSNIIYQYQQNSLAAGIRWTL